MEEMVAVVTTGNDKDLLMRISKRLLERHLIACAQIAGPVESVYWWKGAIEEATEWVVVMKTRKTLYDAVEREIGSLHSYEVPEIVSVPIDRFAASYGRWLENETAGVP